LPTHHPAGRANSTRITRFASKDRRVNREARGKSQAARQGFLPGTEPKGDAGTGGNFGFFGFLLSRLVFCWPLGIGILLEESRAYLGRARV